MILVRTAERMDGFVPHPLCHLRDRIALPQIIIGSLKPSLRMILLQLFSGNRKKALRNMRVAVAERIAEVPQIFEGLQMRINVMDHIINQFFVGVVVVQKINYSYQMMYF